MGKPKRGLLPHQKAFQPVLKKQIESPLPFDSIPEELLLDQNLDLRVWSMLMCEKSAKRLLRLRRELEWQHAELRLSLEEVPEIAPQILVDADERRKLARIEAFAAQRRIAEETRRSEAYLQAQETIGVLEMHLSGAFKLKDLALADLALACPNLRVLDLSGSALITDVGLRNLALTCPRIERIDLSGCYGLCGAGLAALGKQCKRLTDIKLSGCGRAATGWALAALLQGTPLLTSLDLSKCGLLNDGDCNNIARHCQALRLLNIADCRQSGDVGIVSIAAKCTCIEQLNLSRSELPHKLTDSALLAVAEGCGTVLSELNLRGCEQVTDVGVAWIAARAGATLQALNLRGCARITNAACRALAEHCTALERLDLRGNRRITDIGVRVLGLALGSTLRQLDLSFMHLLTDGTDRGFGHEGVFALMNEAKLLESIQLDGCFQLAGRALRAISTSHCIVNNLVELSLNGCPRLTADGLEAVACQAQRLERLSLASCGANINDTAVTALARHAGKTLRILVLRDCEHWGQAGAKSIAKYCAETLERLDCSGCSGLDDESIAELGAAEFLQLRHLFLARCPKICDIGASWLLEGMGSKHLVTLALHKTCVTNSALKGHLDRFAPLSELIREPDFFGFRPRQRWEQRKIVLRFAVLRSAAVRIEASYRGLLGRRKFKKHHDQRTLRRGALRLQRQWRGVQGRFLAAQRRTFKERQEKAATRIQAIYRREAAKCVRRLLILANLVSKRNAAARVVQKAWRNAMQKRRDREWLIKARRMRRLREAVARLLQRIARGYLGRKKAAAQYRKNCIEHERRMRAAAAVQRRLRGMAARGAAKSFRIEQTNDLARRHEAAMKIQRCFRCRRTSIILLARKAKRLHRETAAVQIQCSVRAHQAVLLVYRKVSSYKRIQEQAASILIQRTERARRAHREVMHRQAEAQAKWQKVTEASMMLQRKVRGDQGRAFAMKTRAQHQDFQLRLEGIRIWGATMIAAGIRGFLGRRTARNRLEEKRGKWKEMFDEDAQRTFFYNQVTGEIRWRRPQELLELMKRPVCDNCGYFDAWLECAACCEFYCADCWSSVHYGGKRATHPFRSLYDAYGKRVDHGDGTFDSRWPTEVLQDDLAGILLRVAPHRDPIEICGAWHRYEENGVTFYYNPISGEGSYEAPRAVVEHFMTPLQLAQARSEGAAFYFEDKPNQEPQAIANNYVQANNSVGYSHRQVSDGLMGDYDQAFDNEETVAAAYHNNEYYNEAIDQQDDSEAITRENAEDFYRRNNTSTLIHDDPHSSLYNYGRNENGDSDLSFQQQQGHYNRTSVIAA